MTVFLYITAALTAATGVLVFVGKTPWIKALSVRIFITCIIISIVLFAVDSNMSYALDIAIIFSILGFIDVQFISVFLRKKGDL